MDTAAFAVISQLFSRRIITHDDLPECTTDFKFLEGSVFNNEEDVLTEFKHYTGSDAVRRLLEITEKTICGFLNSEGGTMLWGISDDAIVRGMPLAPAEKDKIRTTLSSKLERFEPVVRQSLVSVEFRRVVCTRVLYVVEVRVGQGSEDEVYFAPDSKPYYRRDAATHVLSPQILKQRLQTGPLTKIQTLEKTIKDLEAGRVELKQRLVSQHSQLSNVLHECQTLINSIT